MMATHTNKDAPNIMHYVTKGSVGAEIGVWMGNSSEKFRDRGVAELHLVDAWSVEPYKENSEMSYQDYISKYQKVTNEFSEGGFMNYYNQVYKHVVDKFKNDKHVMVHRMESTEWFEIFSDLQLDWIYVDGDHSYEGCLADLENALTVLKPGGILMGDDYGWVGAKWSKPGVTKAVDEFTTKHGFTSRMARHGMTQFAIKVD